MFCPTYGVDIGAFGRAPKEKGKEAREQICLEGYILTGFASFFVMYPRKRNNPRNSAAHAKRTVGVHRSYYCSKLNRTPETGDCVDF